VCSLFVLATGVIHAWLVGKSKWFVEPAKDSVRFRGWESNRRPKAFPEAIWFCGKQARMLHRRKRGLRRFPLVPGDDAAETFLPFDRSCGCAPETDGDDVVACALVGPLGVVVIEPDAVAAAHLAFNLALPTEAAGSKQLSLPDREITWIRKLYEKGIAGFYDVVLSQKGWRVDAGKTIGWQIESKSLGIDKILPSMRTDIILDHPVAERRIVIDTKFNSVVTRGWYREETLRSGYIYQIYAYLRSQEGNGDPLAEKASGLLLHPSVGDMVNEAVMIQNHEIRFATVDLGATAKEIREQLLQVLGVSYAG